MFTYIFYIKDFRFASPTRICLTTIIEDVLRFTKIFEIIDFFDEMIIYTFKFLIVTYKKKRKEESSR